MRFIEVDVGVIEGMHFSEIEEKYGEEYKRWRSSDIRDEDFHFERGESKREVCMRVFDGLNYYAESSPYQNIAISAHGIVLSQVLLRLEHKEYTINNGSIISLEYDNGNWKVTEIL